MSVARWSLLSKNATKARSSHALSVTHDGLLLMHGGELKPRQPVDNGTGDITSGSIHTFDLKMLRRTTYLDGDWGLLPPYSQSPVPGLVPEPRVGATAVWNKPTDSLYLWGGRGGVHMTPLDRVSAGPWRALLSSSSIQWQRLVEINEDEGPEPRSYHSAVFFAGKFYIHAGCPISGRLNTLHAFDLSSNRWTSLASAPHPARGGTGLAVVILPDQGAVALRFGGFAGYEVGNDHSLDIYNISSDTWQIVVPAPDSTHGYPGARSVHGFVPFQSKSNSSAVALLYHGEREASKVGHAGAGMFWDDVWLLDYFTPEGKNGEFQWRKVGAAVGGEMPEGRGWFPSASYVGEDGETKAVMFGGLLASNQRSEELWVLEIA